MSSSFEAIMAGCPELFLKTEIQSQAFLLLLLFLLLNTSIAAFYRNKTFPGKERGVNGKQQSE